MTTALTQAHNVQLQLASRQKQLAAVNRQIKSGAYSEEDVIVLREKAAALRRMITMYADALKSA